MTASLVERLQALAKYETAFTSPDFRMGGWADVTPEADGVMQMPWYHYSDAAEAFIADACAFGWVVDFDWMEWSASPDGQCLLAAPALVAGASADDLARMLTVFVRGDRFSEGDLAAAYESGMLVAIMCRAAELAEAELARENP